MANCASYVDHYSKRQNGRVQGRMHPEKFHGQGGGLWWLAGLLLILYCVARQVNDFSFSFQWLLSLDIIMYYCQISLSDVNCQQTQDIDPMSVQCWSTVYDADTTLCRCLVFAGLILTSVNCTAKPLLHFSSQIKYLSL